MPIKYVKRSIRSQTYPNNTCANTRKNLASAKIRLQTAQNNVNDAQTAHEKCIKTKKM